MKKATAAGHKPNNYRIAFPDDEKAQPWLPLLMDAYAVCDEGVNIAIGRETKKSGRTLACGRGCMVCCRVQTDIPAYPIELVGISWYIIEKLMQPFRAIVKSQLITRQKDGSCPFLADGACAVYSVRPMACRQFNVFTHPCGENEDAFHTRRQDVLTPIESFTEEALSRTLPFYGISRSEVKKRGIPVRLLNAQVRVLRDYPWEELAIRMDDFDFRQMGGADLNAMRRCV